MWKNLLRRQPENAGRGLIWLAILACAIVVTGTTPVVAKDSPHGLPTARDLAADAKLAAKDGVPVVVLYTRADCSWCEKLRREYLLPLSKEKTPQAVIREIHMDEREPLVDFAGRRTTSADFSKAQKASFAPTLMFYDPRGQASAEAIVGFRTADFYGAYLERALETSRQHIAQLSAQPSQVR